MRLYALLIAAAACSQPVQRVTNPERVEPKWCLIATITAQHGAPRPILGCVESRDTCEWGRNRIIRGGRWVGVRSVGQCFAVEE